MDLSKSKIYASIKYFRINCSGCKYNKITIKKNISVQNNNNIGTFTNQKMGF